MHESCSVTMACIALVLPCTSLASYFMQLLTESDDASTLWPSHDHPSQWGQQLAAFLWNTKPACITLACLTDVSLTMCIKPSRE